MFQQIPAVLESGLPAEALARSNCIQELTDIVKLVAEQQQVLSSCRLFEEDTDFEKGQRLSHAYHMLHTEVVV